MTDGRLDKLQQRVVEAHVQATESALDLFGVFDFPGIPRDIYGDVDGLQPVPPGGIPPYYWNNRGRGEVLPVYTTWLQLKYIRDRSRRLCRENEFAICATENRKNYIVGDGFTYRATGPDEELNGNAQQLIDTWATAIELAEYELDGMERLDMDGEFFLRFFYRDSGLIELRFIEPEHVKDIAGDPWSPADSFGVKSAIDDVEDVLGYQVITEPWINDTPTLVPAEEVMHVKLNVPRNAKRGLPTFYPVESNLRRANKLLASMAAMAETRAKIALIRKLLNATGSAAASMVNSLKAGSITDTMTNQTITMERLPYSSILTSTGNVEYEMPGANVDASGFVEVLQAELRGIASRLQMPEWMLTSNADATNYNQAFVSESHAVKAFRRVQRMLCRRFGESRHLKSKSVVWRQVEYAVERGILDPNTLTQVKIQCEGPSLIARDKGEEAETNKVYFEMGLKSKSTISQEIGLDRTQELDNISKENKARVENANVTGPAGVRQQESVQGEPKPGELDPTTKEPFEPETEPDMNEYVYNKFKSKYGDQDAPDKSTGYLLRNGQPIKMGNDSMGSVTRQSHHKEGLPSRKAMERWGWETPLTMHGRSSLLPASPPINNLKYKGDALGELLDKSHMIRTHVANDHMSFEYSHPLSTSQKKVIRDFVIDRKPGEVVFSRRLPEEDKHAGVANPSFHHKILPWHEVDDYLNGTQESVQNDNEEPDYEGLVKAQALTNHGKSKNSMNPATGFLTRRGEPIDIGAFNSGSFAEPGEALEHDDFVPTDEEQEKWGWPETRSSEDRLNELMKRSGLLRVRLMNNGNTLAIHHALPLTSSQKEELHSFALKQKPSDIIIDHGKKSRTFSTPQEFEEHLYGTQESVQKVTETKDNEGQYHSPTHGQYVQPEFGPEFPLLMDPKAKQSYSNRKTIALQQDYMRAAQAHADNLNKLQQAAYVSETGETPAPEELESLNKEVQKSMQTVRKAWDAFQTSSQESKELASGPIKPDLAFLDRTLTSGPFHILSAGKNMNHPAHGDVKPEEFAERHKQLGEDLNNGGYKYIELKGKYGGLEEPSYLVPAAEDHAHIFRTLGFKYGQESVIHSHKGQNKLAFVTGPSSNTAHHGTGFSYLPDAEDNYSEYTDGNGNKAKFALNFDFNTTHAIESVKEAVAPQSGRSGFTAGDFRDMLHSYLPPKENVEETHDPSDVAKFYHELSNAMKARTGFTLPEVLKDHRHGNLHSNAGEAVIAAIHGGPFEGHSRGGWDSHKVNKSGVTIGADSKMTADTIYKNRRLKLDSGTINDMQNRVAKTGAFPVLFGFNPGHSDKGGMIVAHKGAVNFPTRDTPDLQQKVAKGDAAVLAKFQDVGDFLKDPAAIGSAQEAWKKLANTVKPKHLSTALDEFQHKQAVDYLHRLQGLAGRGDKTARSKLKDFGLE